jgi:hypothetical protein
MLAGELTARRDDRSESYAARLSPGLIDPDYQTRPVWSARTAKVPSSAIMFTATT